jgi:glycosyltransferase involved in cell wall biosynthesis
MGMNNNKICFVVSSVITVQAFLREHLEALGKDFNIFLVGNFSESDFATLQKLNISGYHSVEIYRKINLFKDLISVIKLRNYFKSEEFFATHSITPKAGLLTAMASRMAAIPNRIHIFTGQVWYTRTGFVKWLLILLDKVTVSLNTHILVDGESQRNFLINTGILRATNSSVLGKGSISGVNIAKFQPQEEMRIELRNSLNLNHKVVFGFFGRLNKDKGIAELYAAFNKLAQVHPSVHLLFIGGDEGNMLSILPLHKNIRESINFTYLGYVEKPEEILQTLDIFCLPSHREGFGTSVLEASCLGIPVICSDTYGLMDTMIDGVTGLRHRVKDIDDLFNQMLKMTENKKLREEFGRNARTFAIENFSSELITEEWVRFYKSLD